MVSSTTKRIIGNTHPAQYKHRQTTSITQNHYRTLPVPHTPNLHTLYMQVFTAYLANDEHDWPLSTAHTPHVVETSYTMLHAQKQLGTLQSSTGKKGERGRERERERSN